jgi:hypothetical protein
MCMEELTTSSELEASTSSIGDVCESWLLSLEHSYHARQQYYYG